MASRRMDVYQSLRFASQSYCTLSEIIATESVFVVRHAYFGDSVRGLVRQILAFLEGGVSDEFFERAMAHVLPDYQAGADSTIENEVLRLIPGARRPGDFAAAQTDDMRHLIESVVCQYAIVFDRRPLLQIDWPKEIFLNWDRGDAFVDGPIHLLGPARFLICGPYMHLTRGKWLATVEIEVRENHSGNRMCADILSRDILAAVIAELPAEGVFVFKIGFEILEPLLPVEIRFQILSGAIEGTFLLRKVGI